jgi:hypothetical protein
MPGMKKRTLAAILWFYTGWYAGAMLAEFLGVGAALGPIIGAAAAGLVFADPRRIIWTAQAATAGSSNEALPEPA